MVSGQRLTKSDVSIMEIQSATKLLGSPNRQKLLNKTNITHEALKWRKREVDCEIPSCHNHPEPRATLAVSTVWAGCRVLCLVNQHDSNQSQVSVSSCMQKRRSPPWSVLLCLGAVAGFTSLDKNIYFFLCIVSCFPGYQRS